MQSREAHFILTKNEFLEFLTRLSRCVVNGSSIKHFARFSGEKCAAGLPFFEPKEFEGRYFTELNEKMEREKGIYIKRERET